MLRDNTSIKKEVEDVLNNILAKLLDNKADEAKEYVKWSLKKLIDTNANKRINILKKKKRSITGNDHQARETRNKINEEMTSLQPLNYPNVLNPGDIIHVNYGAGYCVELSNGHYGVILARKGEMWLVAPLTSTMQPDGESTVCFNSLGLPGENPLNPLSYINFGQIRYLHYRRIENIIGVIGGKLQISIDDVKNILQKWNNIINISLISK